MKNKGLLTVFFIILVFIFLTILYTYPLIFRIHSSFFGDPQWTFDSKASIYSIWLTKYQWLNKIPFTYNPLINFPFGVDLTGYPSQWGLRIPLLILSLWKDEIFSFNFFILGSFILSAVIVYYFVVHITHNRVCGFISGLIFSFSPYHTLKAFSHLGLAAIQWIPLYLLCLILLEDGKSYKMALLCGISFALVILSSYYYGYMVVVVTGIFFLMKLLFKRSGGIRFYLLAIGVSVVLILPFMYDELKSTIFYKCASGGHIKPYYDLFRYSAHISDYFRPSEYHPVFSKIDFWFIKPYTSASRHWAERTLYLGIVPFILAIFGVLCWKKSGRGNRFIMAFFLLSSIIAFLFSLPPEIKIGKIDIYLPNYFAYKILPMFRCPARFGLVVILCVSVLAGVGIKELLDKILSKKIRSAVITVLAGLIIFEFTVIPPFRNVDLTEIPEVYEWLAKEPEDIVVVEYPFLSKLETTHNDRYLFYQRIHKKKLINGAPGDSLGDAFRRECLDIANPKTLRLLAYLGADYAIVYKNGYDKEQLAKIEKEHMLELVGDFPDAVVYRLIAEPVRVPAIFWQNFGSWEKWDDGDYWRWMGNDATVWVGNGPMKNQNAKCKMQDAKLVDIKFKILAFAKTRNLEVYVNDVLVKELSVGAPSNPGLAQEVELKNVLLQPGGNMIEFYTPQGEDRIGDVLGNEDNRRVSFAISELKFE